MAEPLVVGITGVTLTGNMGGQAMLFATLDQLRARNPEHRAMLFSVYPHADRRANSEAVVTVVDTPPLRLLAVYLPLLILLWPVKGFRFVRTLLSQFGYFRALFACDLLLDHSGIAFVDGRGFALLIYNVSCALPGLFAGIPVVKLSQALGPFDQPLNRMLARWTLSRCCQVIARGAASERHLHALHLNNTANFPDVTFTLRVNAEDRVAAEQRVASLNGARRPVIVSPSRVVERLCAQDGIDFLDEMARFTRELVARGESVWLVPHSLGQGADKNNDISLSRALHERLDSKQVTLIDDVHDSRVLRALIGKGDIFIGNRFHAVVSALAEQVPLLVIGWSHKYRELTEPFGLDPWVLDHRQLAHGLLLEKFAALRAEQARVRERLAEHGPRIRALADQNYAILDHDT